MYISMRLVLLCFFTLLLHVAVCAEDYYKLLGVNKQASDRELKKAYRALSKKYHPDKNPGNDSAREKFVEIADAYEALSEPETRRIYDQYGHEGLKQHKESRGRAHGNHDPFDLFSRFFGGGGHFGQGGGERKGPNMEVRVTVPLRDFYNGVETEFTIEKQMICETCSGSGSQDGHKDTCGQCGGRGMVVQKLQLAPGIFQQVQSQCGACGGQGKVVRNKCKTCGGARVVRGRDTHQLSVERGMPKGTRIQYENEADEGPDFVAGDLLVHLAEEEPRILDDEAARTDGTFFRRRGKDLLWREVLSLREAWMGGWSRTITHLDGHPVKLSRKRGEAVQPETVEVVKGQGMPIWRDNGEGTTEEFGDLLVSYVVIIPDQMEKAMFDEFGALWDKWAKKKGIKTKDEL